MTFEEAKWIVAAIQESGHEANVESEYSGRGMYGAKTHAVVTDAHIGTVLSAVMDYVREEPLDDIPISSDDGYSWDQMGLGIVIY